MNVAHPARIYDYWLGGKDNFAADRKAAEEALAVMPAMAHSYLAVSHASSDIDAAQQSAATRSYNTRSGTPITLRSRAGVARFFTGLDLVPPGITPLGQWAPDASESGPGRLPTYTALARKP